MVSRGELLFLYQFAIDAFRANVTAFSEQVFARAWMFRTPAILRVICTSLPGMQTSADAFAENCTNWVRAGKQCCRAENCRAFMK